MPFLSALETALNNDVVTPEIEKQINENLWSRDFSEKEMSALQELFEKLESGETQVAATA